MTASLTPNREAVKGALWWLYEGALFLVSLANTSGAGTPPALDGLYEDWTTPTNYLLDGAYDLFITGGTVDYGVVLTNRAELEQLVITLDYDTNVTYTDLLVLCIPAINPGGPPPIHATPLVAVIHESSPVTLLSTQTKTYNLDLFAEWI